MELIARDRTRVERAVLLDPAIWGAAARPRA